MDRFEEEARGICGCWVCMGVVAGDKTRCLATDISMWGRRVASERDAEIAALREKLAKAEAALLDAEKMLKILRHNWEQESSKDLQVGTLSHARAIIKEREAELARLRLLVSEAESEVEHPGANVGSLWRQNKTKT